MRAHKTVLVLGAGASQGFGLPLGKELKLKIADDLNILFEFGSRQKSGSFEIVEALRALVRSASGHQGDINPHRAAAVSISRAMRLSGSIDEFVERHRDDSLISDCAKLAIANQILVAERQSKLFHGRNSRDGDLIGNASDCWLAYLLRDLTRGSGKADLTAAFENLHIINFNYDRCVEHFIFLWLQQVYGLTESEASVICQQVRIFHPYGALAPLPFQNPTSHIPFGGECSGTRLLTMMQNIRTYSEAVDQNAGLENSRFALGKAQKIVFLGFAFHEQNMRLLSVDREFSRPTLRCYASALGVSGPKLDLDKEAIAQSFRVEDPAGLLFYPIGGTCEDFWSEYGDVVIR